MRNVVCQLEDEEAERIIEDEYENMKQATVLIMKAIEDVCAKHQIRYISIDVE